MFRGSLAGTSRHPQHGEVPHAPAWGGAAWSAKGSWCWRCRTAWMTQWHKGSCRAESCVSLVPVPGTTGQLFHGFCEMTSLGRTFKHHPSSLPSPWFIVPPSPTPPRLIHKDFKFLLSSVRQNNCIWEQMLQLERTVSRNLPAGISWCHSPTAQLRTSTRAGAKGGDPPPQPGPRPGTCPSSGVEDRGAVGWDGFQ